MGQLVVDAINPVMDGAWKSLRWLVRAVRWEATCGFCRTRFSETGWILRSSAVCPHCGTRNRLPIVQQRPAQPMTGRSRSWRRPRSRHDLVSGPWVRENS